MEYKEKQGKPDVNEYDFVFNESSLSECSTYDELIIANKRYCFVGGCSYILFKEDNIVVAHNWTTVAFFSLSDGNLTYFSGINDSIVGIDSLKYSFIIVADTSVFLVNKNYYFPTGYNSFPDNILDFIISDDKEELTLKFLEDDDLNLKVYEL